MGFTQVAPPEQKTGLTSITLRRNQLQMPEWLNCALTPPEQKTRLQVIMVFEFDDQLTGNVTGV